MNVRRIVPIIALMLSFVFAAAPRASGKKPDHIDRVLLVSVDGMHAVDLETLIAHGGTTMGSLANNGVRYTNAMTPRPSDSFPGLMALITGGSPASAGIWYDVTFNHALFPPGSNCSGNPGTMVVYDESLDIDDTQLGGGGSPGFNATSTNVSNLPLQSVDGSCTPVFPHQYLLVNTIFEVVKSHGHTLTAWSDKHPAAYEIVNGPSGKGVDELWSPEINSQPPAALDPVNPSSGGAFTDTLAAVEYYDGLKVNAILHEIDGFDPTGQKRAGVPTLFGMNFQSVSVGQKLPTDPTGFGQCGYADSVGTPNPCLQNALNFVDTAIGSMVSELQKKNLLDRTLIVITAKHGQSPIDINRLVRIPADNGGNSPAGILGSEVAAGGYGASEDDVSLIWLNDPNNAAADAALLSSYPNASQVAGIGQVFSGVQLQLMWGNPSAAAVGRIPDLVVQPNYGTVYTGKKKKIAEHGGFANDDRNVALLLSNPELSSSVIHGAVATEQVAPTIVRALGFDPKALEAVLIEGTQTLPGVSF